MYRSGEGPSTSLPAVATAPPSAATVRFTLAEFTATHSQLEGKEMDFYFMFLDALPTCMSMNHGPAEVRRGPQAFRLPRTGVVDNCGCWESNPGPPEVQPVIWTTEPSL